MRKLFLLFVLVFSYGFSQTNCELCVEQGGFYCGDDEANWTQYSPLGCVPNGFNNLLYLNDGWLDCVDGSDEDGAVPTTLEDCNAYGEPCDTTFIEVPIYIYETIFQTDTIYNTEYITQIVVDTVEVETFVPEYIFQTDTLWLEGALDTLYIDVIEYIDVLVFDTIIETEYVEFFTTDTIVEYVEIINTEYIDCATGMPCGNSAILEILQKTKTDNKIYNLNGQEIYRRNGLYIEDGKINLKLN
tara:strand:+ start:681 stop:1412 length:732 start_codon:yes stop_codon:yes gene_type:complete